jgi:hypothetical protein
MTKITKLGLAAIVAFSMPCFAEPSETQPGRPPAPVTVVNTPLPVTGALTGNVSINGGSVSVTGTAQVRDVENPGRQAFAKRVTCTINFGNNVCDAFVAVPSGKQLVIETLSVLSHENTAGAIPAGALIFFTNGELGVISLPMVFRGSFAGLDAYHVTQPVRVYADAGSSLRWQGVQNVRANPPLEPAFDFQVSGYLLDCGAGTGCPLP